MMTDEQRAKTAWLNRAFYADNKIKALEEVRKKNKSIAERCTASYESDGTTSGSHNNSQEKILHQLCDDDLKIQTEYRELCAVRDEIRDAITAVHNDEYETILYMRHLAYMTVQAIAEDLHYDRKTIQRKYIRALDLIETVGKCP